MPTLRSLLAREPKRKQTWQEQLAIAKQWAIALGGTVKKIPKG